jgi:hypothetical protein
MLEMRNACTILVEKGKGKNYLKGQNVMLNWILRKWDATKWSGLLWCRKGSRGSILQTRLNKRQGIPWTETWLFASQEGLLSSELAEAASLLKYFGYAGSESRLGHRLFWLRFFVAILSSSSEILGWYLQLGHVRFLPHLSLIAQ